MDIRLPDPEGRMLTVQSDAIPRHILEQKAVEWECSTAVALARLVNGVEGNPPVVVYEFEPGIETPDQAVVIMVGRGLDPWELECPAIYEQQITDQGTLFCPLCRLDTEACYTPSLQWLHTETTQRSHPYFVTEGHIMVNTHPLEAGRPIWPQPPEILHSFLWCARCGHEYQPGQFGLESNEP